MAKNSATVFTDSVIACFFVLVSYAKVIFLQIIEVVIKGWEKKTIVGMTESVFIIGAIVCLEKTHLAKSTQIVTWAGRENRVVQYISAVLTDETAGTFETIRILPMCRKKVKSWIKIKKKWFWFAFFNVLCLLRSENPCEFCQCVGKRS